MSPYVDRTDPPLYLGYGAEDALVVPATQGDPLAQVWSQAHDGNRVSVSYDVIEGAGHNLPLEDTVTPLNTFFDRVSGGGGLAGAL